MTDYTISPTQVRPLDGCLTRTLAAGEAFALGKVGQIVADGDVEMANATAAAGVNGVLVIPVAGEQHDEDGDVASGETISAVLFGPVYVGEDITLDMTKMYFVATTDGKITDVAPTNYRRIGYPISAHVLFFNPDTAQSGS